MLLWLAEKLATVLGWALSARGLALLFLVVAAGLATGGWLRPPLSPDIGGLHVPLRPGTVPAETLLRGPRTIPGDSAGGLVLALVGLGAIVVLIRPGHLGGVAGLLLVGGAVASAA